MDKNTELPEWAPDDCPPKVVSLISDEQYLEDLKLRGLASADSSEYHQAIRRLKTALHDAFLEGKYVGQEIGDKKRRHFLLAVLGAAFGSSAGIMIGLAFTRWLLS